MNKLKDEEDIHIILNRRKILDDLKSMLNFFSYFKNNNKNIDNEWTKLNEKYNNFSKGNFQEMKAILNELKKEGLYDYEQNIKNKNSNCFILFNLFRNEKEALDFLTKKNVDDIELFFDIIDNEESVNEVIKMSDISDTINCVRYFQEIKKISGGFKDIINHINLKLNDKNILKSFRKYLDIYIDLTGFSENFNYNSPEIFQEINSIITKSNLLFNKDNEDIKIINNLGEKNELVSFDKLIELKYSIQYRIDNKNLIKKPKAYKTIYNKIKFFNDLVDDIEEIYNLMKILRTKGGTLPKFIYLTISYPNLKYFLDNLKKETEFKFIRTFLSNAVNNFINKLNLIYKEKINMRFIYGKQINYMLNHIQGKIQINSFLRYILNLVNCDINLYEGEKVFNRLTQDYINEIELYNNDSFNLINQYITSLFKQNNSSIENHYKNISIKKYYVFKGIYIFNSKYNSIEEDIIRIFLDKIGTIPVAQNILINNKETTFEEMQAFFNRAILCEYNTLFIAGIDDSFSDFQIKCMLNLVNELLTYKNNNFNRKNEDKIVKIKYTHSYMDSCLVFIYSGKNYLFLNELEKFNPIELKFNPKEFWMDDLDLFGNINQIIYPLREKLFLNTYIILSEICGLGKSTKIKKFIQTERKIYIYFPLDKNLTKNFIYNKLDKIIKEINNKTMNNYKDIAIHLDLFETKDYNVLNEFLFSFLITKFYNDKGNIIYIPNNIKIFIEIPNSFYDFLSNFGILKFFNNEIITINNLPKLDLSKDTINLFKNVIDLNNQEIYQWIKNNIGLERFFLPSNKYNNKTFFKAI